MDDLIAEVVTGFKQIDPARQQLILDLLERLVEEQRGEA